MPKRTEIDLTNTDDEDVLGPLELVSTNTNEPCKPGLTRLCRFDHEISIISVQGPQVPSSSRIQTNKHLRSKHLDRDRKRQKLESTGKSAADAITIDSSDDEVRIHTFLIRVLLIILKVTTRSISSSSDESSDTERGHRDLLSNPKHVRDTVYDVFPSIPTSFTSGMAYGQVFEGQC